MTFTLKADGPNLTGNVLGGSGGCRGGPAVVAARFPAATDISNGKIDGDKVSFEVKRSFNGNESVTKYEGTLSGDTLNSEGNPYWAERNRRRATTLPSGLRPKLRAQNAIWPG